MRHLICLLLIAGAMACKNNQNDEDSVRIAKEANKDNLSRDSNTAMSDDDADEPTMAVDRADADFAVEAASGSMMEVQLGGLAKTHAVNARVKNFAAMMINDHMKMNEELKRIATAKNITLPQALSDEAANDIEKLNKKEKGEFDRTYMRMMVNDHRKDLNEFEKAAKDCKDPALRSFVKESLPVLKKHLDSARAIEAMFDTGNQQPSPAYP
jgi:putative membrane protein